MTQKLRMQKKLKNQKQKLIGKISARMIIAKINAFHPNPGAWFELNGSRIKVLKG